jgi:hypothetical protein
MALTSGAGPHQAWLTVNGSQFPIEHGSATLSAARKSSTFSGILPLSYPGAAETFANLGSNQSSITVQTRGVSAQLITGEIDDVDFDFIQRTINYTGRDTSAPLHDNKSSEKWQNKMPSDIVSDLIGRIGLTGNVTASSLMAGKQVQQDFVHLSDNVSYAYTISKLAQFDGARWWVDGSGQFHYVPYGSPVGSYSIMVNQDVEPISSDCIQLRVKRNIQAGKNIAVTVKSWSPRKKQMFGYTSNVESSTGGGGTNPYNYHIPNQQQDHVTKHAQSQANEKARHEFTVTATVVGDPTVAAGMGLSLTGTDYFDQTFDIDAVQHDFGMPGHTTNITARSAKTGRSAS